ncbi:MAG: ComEC/Rec2 family competence protein [Actinobacteria bacterium]|nr:MAG: ComEC/Rec2 family competence protein [Actinomycetota bacterium]
MMPNSDPGSATKIKPTSASDALMATATTPPRLRTKLRLAMTPSTTMRGERGRALGVSTSFTLQSYETRHGRSGNALELGDNSMLALAIVLLVSTRLSGTLANMGNFMVGICVVVLMLLIRHRQRKTAAIAGCSTVVDVVVLFVVVVMLGAGLGAHSWQQLRAPQLGSFQGVAKVMEDPQWRNGGVQTVLQLDGERFIVYAYGLPARRLSNRKSGEVLWVSGDRLRLETSKQNRLSYRHIVGTFAVLEVSDRFGNGAVLYVSANNIRTALARSAAAMPRDEGALFMGLIIGDDRQQPASMITAFRKSGLSHLTAVSGQNVAFLLTVMAPLLMRARSSWRLGLTMFVLLWFTVVTRGEPSVLRAAMMAGFVALGSARGRDTPGRRMLGLAIIVLIVCDPLLAWSVGFWMSSSATFGLLVITPQLAQVIPGPTWFSTALSTTMGAQLGVMPITAIIFHSAPVIALVTNLLAVPIAGAVMLVGIPLGMLAGILSQISGGLLMSTVVASLMWPVQIAVRWVWWVAVLGERIRMHGTVNAIAWCIVAMLVISARISAWRSI